ncbi:MULTISPECIES: beta-galactosidase [unclassified Pseudoalteromonas]|uniref:beta-galactosidase n=1 Tax=unclassified Pseudoalteromonas TaxID=194690 RepID=UPI0025B48EF7|nr:MULTISPECIES: beta-galactosidase [unclassified Pseudoalteromonas]MDN3377452.1 beta-galactosidase [Pseudoalteromonas sp. APC 3893]MDN3385381.1 beta-galactosidase [Pseudoalteromonas sp. APC 4017]
MKYKKNLAVTALLLVLTGCNQQTNTVSEPEAAATTKSSTTILHLLDDAQHTADTAVKMNTRGARVTNRTGIVDIAFDSKKNIYSGITLTPDTPWDWSQYKDFNIAFELANPGQHSVQIYLDISDIDGATYTRTVNVPIGGFNTYYAKLDGHDLATPEGDENVELNFTSGLRSNPATWQSDEIQFTSMWGKKNLNLKGITKISLSVQSVLHDKALQIKSIDLRANPEFDTEFLTHIVDKFGQNAKQDFPSKVNSEAELIADKEQEAKQLLSQRPADRSRFGGWAQGPKLEGTGYFRTAKHNGKWSLVDPDGYLYLATGLDIIRLANSTTLTGYDFDQSLFKSANELGLTPEDSQGLNRVNKEALSSRFVASEVRKDLFEWLPSYDEPMGKHYGYRKSAHSGPLAHGETYSFYSANLERKYGQNNTDFMQKWREITLQRMITWGFTSLGNWTDPSYYDNQQVPYFANGWIIGDFKTVSSGNDFWGAMPDVFDPHFAERANITVENVAKEVKNSPWAVGVFIDNEKSFGRPDSVQSHYGIVINTLGRDAATVPTKAEFSRLMKQKYTDINELNQVWHLNLASWEEFDKGVKVDVKNNDQLADFSIMLTAYADKYFSVVDAAMDKHLPNHLYLGARFPDWGMPIEVVRASAKHVDVISFNAYKEGIKPKKWEFLSEFDKPTIIGEFHVGALDSGLFHPGLIHASNQQDRAKMYTDYMRSVFDNPYFIGAHWFQYIDSPITGRAYDGENYNVGFITVTDRPYTEMVEAAKTVNNEMYERRFKK